MTDPRISLTAVERLQIRETLQDRWRDQVRRITELSLDLHAALDDQADDSELDATIVALELSDARLRLTEIEQALRRLDERSFGRCFACLVPIPVSDLLDDPDARHCRACSGAAARGLAAHVADAR